MFIKNGIALETPETLWYDETDPVSRAIRIGLFEGERRRGR
jgi:hypothetical protein